MRTSAYHVRNEAREERKRQVLAAALVSVAFPGVSSIVVTMNYRGGGFPAVLRTVNYFPGSPAFFRISCLGEGCDDGGLDLTHLMHNMIRSHEQSAKGKLSCENKGSAIAHPDVDYEVAITYS